MTSIFRINQEFNRMESLENKKNFPNRFINDELWGDKNCNYNFFKSFQKGPEIRLILFSIWVYTFYLQIYLTGSPGKSLDSPSDTVLCKYRWFIISDHFWVPMFFWQGRVFYISRNNSLSFALMVYLLVKKIIFN